MKGWGIHAAALAVLLGLMTFVYVGQKALNGFRQERRAYPMSTIARALEQSPRQEACDRQLARKRFVASRVLDRFRADIGGLWQNRTETKESGFRIVELGPIQLKESNTPPAGRDFDSSSWSWEEAYGIVLRTQQDAQDPGNDNRWRDLDAMVRYLIEKDYSRIAMGKAFLPPSRTPHQFRPSGSVARTGAREFTVSLVAGNLAGQEAKLSSILEKHWRGKGYQVRVRWVPDGAYRLRAHRESNRSFVNHAQQTMNIAHLAWTKTVAHELGHILGFDDHYYNVWHEKNCYYTQESRLGDLMSNSEHGAVLPQHWELLERAYPWRQPAAGKPFTYFFHD